MAWVTLPNLSGKVYEPEKSRADAAKHPCPDCFVCQKCSDDRCGACCNAKASAPCAEK